jgi:iron complex outermembrane recepter protein
MKSILRHSLPIIIGVGIYSPVLLAQSVATAQNIEEVEVLGDAASVQRSRLQALQMNSAGGFSIVDAQQFTTQSVSNLSDAARDLPGLWVGSGSGDDNMYLSSRGSNLDSIDYDNNGIKLLQDGLPITAADGSNHNRLFDPKLHAI